MNKGIKVKCYITDIKLDPDDDLTEGLTPDQVMFYFCHNDTIVNSFTGAQAA